MTSNLVHFAPHLPGLPEELLLARDRGEVLFITGSGTSRALPTDLPDFSGLVQKVYDDLDAVVGAALKAALEYKSKKRDPIRRLQTKPNYFGVLNPQQSAELYRCLSGEFDIALGMLERRLDEPGIGSVVRKSACKILRLAVQPNDVHQALRALGQRNNQPFIATTNYDMMLEAVKPKLNPAKASFGLTSLPRPSRRRAFHGIFHIHGLLPPKPADPAEMILTDQDFGEYYMRRRTTADFVYDASRNYHIVLVGYSLADAPMRYLLNAIAGDELHFADIKSRYAFIPVKGVDPRAEADWRSRGIIPIPYDSTAGHQQLCDVLEAWVEARPKMGSLTWEKKKLLAITSKPISDSAPGDISVFRYLLRRSTPSERLDLLKYIGSKLAPFDWLEEAIKIVGVHP